MKELILNDGRKMEVQSVTESENLLLVRKILTSSDELKLFFSDEFSTSKMTLKENNQDVAKYENYSILNYIKEETGGIWEVALSQTAPAVDERLDNVEQGLQQTVANLEKAVAELTMLISTIMTPTIPEIPTEEVGGDENV